jgi:hypothetical protein
MMIGLQYASLFVGTISGVVFTVGAAWYAVNHQPLFVILQSRIITFGMKFLVLDLCVLILALLGYNWAHHIRTY